MKFNTLIKEILKNNDGIITTKNCNEHHIPRVYLTRMIRDNKLVRLERGIYADKTGVFDDYYFFQTRFQRSVFSYQSALYLHGLTDRVPFQKEVTLYKGYNPHTIPSNVTVHFVNREIYGLGIVKVETQMGNLIDVYDKEKSICDLIKHRGEIDVEIFKKVIKAYFNLRKKDFDALYFYAEKMDIVNEVSDLVEVFYE